MFGDWKYPAIACQNPAGRMLIREGVHNEARWQNWVDLVRKYLWPYYKRAGYGRVDRVVQGDDESSTIEHLALAVYAEGVWLGGVERTVLSGEDFSRRIFSRGGCTPWSGSLRPGECADCMLLDQWLESVLSQVTSSTLF